jgi:hypothetical protein
VTYNRFYGQSLLANLGLAFSPAQLLSPWLAAMLPLALLAALGLVAAALSRAGRGFTLLGALGLATPVAVGLPGAFAPHYYQLWLPALVLGAGGAVAALGRLIPGRIAWAPHAVGGIALTLGAVYQLPLYQLPAEDWSLLKYGPIFVEERKLAREVDALLAPGETFYEWGSEVGLYFWTGRRPPTGALFVWPVTAGPERFRLTSRLLQDLERARPELLVVANWTGHHITWPHPARDWQAAHYRPFPGGGERGPFTLHVRRGGALERRIERAARR